MRPCCPHCDKRLLSSLSPLCGWCGKPLTDDLKPTPESLQAIREQDEAESRREKTQENTARRFRLAAQRAAWRQL